MKKKGFTLVELLAVIVILSVIAIITVPIIGNVIEESKKKALEQSAYGLVEAADYYAIKYEGEHGFEFEDGKQISSDKLDYKGTIQGTGKLYIDNNGDISLCINTDKYYVIKNYNSGIEIKDKNEYGCSIEQDPLTNKYVAYLDNGENGPISVYTKSESDERYVLKSELENYATTEALNGVSAVALANQTSIGTLSNLNVSDENKSDLVSAINEVNTDLQKVKSHIGMVVESTTLDTEEKVKEIYGGITWTKIEGRFLLGQSSSYSVNSIGGEESHTLTVSEIPSHTHDTLVATYQAAAGSAQAVPAPSGWQNATYATHSTGGNGSHNNMPPYKVVYIWERTA